MAEIVLTDDQAEIVATSGHIDARDPAGRLLGYLAAPPELTLEQLAELKRRAESWGPKYTIERVLEHLRRLGEQS